MKSKTETEHFVEMTSEETGALKALVEDKVTQLETDDRPDRWKWITLLKGILAKLSGGQNTGAH